MKKILFSTILMLISYLIVELFSYAAYRIKFGEYNLNDIQQSKLDVLALDMNQGVFEPAAALSDDIQVKPILHPYLGFTVDGKIRTKDCIPVDSYDCYQRIKVPTDGKLQKRSQDKLIVAIVGGSFADGTARGGSPDYYAHLLSGLPQFSDKKIIVYNLASGAYKQPQQLMQISYYYALGAEFDLIINIDGFNELAATFYGWRDSNLHPAFPTSWDKRVSSGIDAQTIDLYSRRQTLNNKHRATANFFLISAIRYSPLMNFAWQILNANYTRQKNTLKQTDVHDQHRPRDFQYEALGPDYDIPDQASLNKFAVELWANSSRAIRALAEGQGAAYYHFIQPNQYIEGAKILSENEQKYAFLEQGGYGNVYKTFYPALAAEGQKLIAEGMNFSDLTYIFKDNAEDLYIDNCCHLNPKGYNYVVQEIIIERIAKDLSNQND